MKFSAAKLRLGLLILVLVIAGGSSLALGVFSFLSSQAENQQNQLSRREIDSIVDKQIREGLGAEVQFDDSTPERTRDSVESASLFIQRRSGLVLNASLKDKLIFLEQEHVAGRSLLITTDRLADAVTDLSLRRLADASEDELTDAANILNRPGDGIILRANGQGHMQSEEFIRQAQRLRQLSKEADPSARLSVRSAIGREIHNRVQIFSRALPAQFGRAPIDGLTPLQAFLVTYSVITDDLLAHSTDQLKRQIRAAHDIMKSRGVAEKEPHTPYGTKGYIFASPMNLLLSDQTIDNLFTRLSQS